MSDKYFDDFLSILNVYVHEAEKCADKKLYIASSTLYGSALETMLLLYCLAGLDEEEMPSDKELRHTFLSDLVEILSEHKIISQRDANYITKLRHLVHPFRYHKRLQEKKLKITKYEFSVLKNAFYRIKDKLLKVI